MKAAKGPFRSLLCATSMWSGGRILEQHRGLCFAGRLRGHTHTSFSFAQAGGGANQYWVSGAAFIHIEYKAQDLYRNILYAIAWQLLLGG